VSTKKEMTVSGEAALKIAEALNATSLRILQVLGCERLDVTTISKRLGLSEAYMSEQVRLLEELKLINVTYERGKRGIRKVCESAVGKVTLVIMDECLPAIPRPTDQKSILSIS
jgi:predicted transcriptional regulator